MTGRYYNELTKQDVLDELANARKAMSTTDLRDRMGITRYSRHQVYRRLTECEAEGLVEKQLLHGGTGHIAHAVWKLTSAGLEQANPMVEDCVMFE